ncbi:uncharacterized protein BO88DRAFT_103141 [Aspergillus vadensis CBS 113365]|uniref:Uncharacterized protein n=1 Tax=Aspergillus vadensis (strain CBS 113365 / IMI 142717 / IBT 24658) TaxID=1448311 RepID=A0A319BMW2_ASPVC|nr:hypothetical protein BO88DRAFT_103141 [Aspergillus vadensis CBS 113365]PYH73691.1 hypothetical protein BO88DRAFT_103141 [Aspergillus vadensis CBS 113365]
MQKLNQSGANKINQNLLNKGTPHSRLIRHTLSSSCLQFGPQLLVRLACRSRRGKETLAGLLRRTGLLHEFRPLRQVEWCGWRHTNGIHVKGVARSFGRVAVLLVCFRVTGANLGSGVGGRWFISRRGCRISGGGFFGRSKARSSAVCRCTRCVGLDESAVDVAQSAWLHALATLGTTTGNNGQVDFVVCLIEPFVLAFAAVRSDSNTFDKASGMSDLLQSSDTSILVDDMSDSHLALLGLGSLLRRHTGARVPRPVLHTPGSHLLEKLNEYATGILSLGCVHIHIYNRAL